MGGYNTSGVRKSYMYISNGTDPLARYDGTSLETYAGIPAPTNLSASRVASGLTSGTITYYAQVTALNSIGETVGSTEAEITVNKSRDSWVQATDKITWSWTASPGADRYQLYITDQSAFENLLDADIPATTTTFTDDGSREINEYVQPPEVNLVDPTDTTGTTSAPKFKSMCVSGNRIWATNDSNNMYTVFWSGTGRNIGTFSDFYGGGSINLEAGGREIPIKVVHFQSGQGLGRATVLCKTPDGAGAVWQLTMDSVTVGDTTFSIPSAQKIVGSVGTESINGTLAVGNDIGFPNRRGWFSLGTQVNYLNVLRTNERSSMIRPYWRSLISSKMDGVASYYRDAKVFISVPTSTDGNTKTVIYDTERSNWSVDWTIGAKQFFEYTDTAGNTHFLFIPTTGNRLVELSENYLGDFGAPFNQSYISPLLSVSKKKTDLLDLQEAILELAKPRGTIKFQVLGIGKDNNFTTLASKTISSSTFGADTGVGSDLFDGFHLSSTNDSVAGGAGLWAISFNAAPSSFRQSTTKSAIRKRAKIYALQFKVYSTSGDTDYTILSLQAKGRLLQRRLPSQWVN
jgi:hypothetical protein